MKQLKTIWFLLIVVVSAVCCWLEVCAFMDLSGKMVGFHPLALFSIPVGLMLSFACFVLAGVEKSWGAALLGLLPAFAVLGPIWFGYNISVFAWSNAIRQHAVANEAAIKSTDFSTAVFQEIPYKDHERMVPVNGFAWPNSAEMIEDYKGIFCGFTVDGVPHVYVHPIRNGCRGVAWLENKSIIGTDPHVRYEFLGTTNWYLWTTSGIPCR